MTESVNWVFQPCVGLWNSLCDSGNIYMCMCNILWFICGVVVHPCKCTCACDDPDLFRRSRLCRFWVADANEDFHLVAVSAGDDGE